MIPIAFDADGHPVPIAEFQFPDEDMIDDDADRAASQAVIRLMHRLLGNDGDDARTIGRRVLILAAALRLRRQNDVANLLGISKPAVCKAVGLIREKLLSRENIGELGDRG